VETVAAVQLALALMRTRPLDHWPEELHDWDDLTRILADTPFSGYSGTKTDVEAVRTLRDRLVPSLQPQSEEEASVALNALADDHDLRPRLIGREVQYQGRDEQLATRLAAALVPALIEAHVSGLIQRVGLCQDAHCDTAFLDLSRKGGRRYCCSRCATRSRVARYRKRV
jgi:predicted RNA-binding Zn ribbon-like protein